MKEEQQDNISQFTHNMKPHYTIITLSIVSLLTFSRAQLLTTQSESKLHDSTANDKNRRILHQPLFQAIQAPPPPPPPPPPDLPDQDQPFSNEFQTGPTPDQWPQPEPPPPATDPITAAQPSKDSKPTKKVAIAITSAILTLGMLSWLAFFLYKNNLKNPNESRKLIGQDNSQSINEESRMPPPSTFLCIEPPEASTTTLINEPYQKLDSGRRFDPYRPSSEIHPLTKPPPPPATNSPPPPPMSSSDEETPSSSRCRNHVATSLPHSRRTSPRSRFSASSPDAKLSSLPRSPTPPPTISLGPLQPSKTLPYTPKRASFSPSPDRQSITIRNNEPQISKIPSPHPPPPPPPPPPLYGAAKTYTPLPVSRQLIRPKSKSPSPKETPSAALKTRPVEEINNVSTILEKAEDKDGSRPQMKALHWDKVPATSDEGTVWDQLKSSSFKLNEDAIDSLFGCHSAKSVPRRATKKFVFPSFAQENRVLDTKKSQNIAILLRALNVTREEVSEAILDGNPEGLDPELFETLVKMAPSKEEEIKLRNCNVESSKLGPAERFLREILDIPFAFKRVEAMLYRANFDTEVKYLRKSFQTLEEASEELKNSRLFLKLLEAVLRTGNRMNNGTNRGEARAFKLDTLLKLVDIKGTDGKTTLLHFVVQEIIRSEGTTATDLPHKSNLKFNEDDFKKQGLAVVAGLSRELGNVKKAAGMDSDVLSSYVTKLETGLQKIRHVLQYEDESTKGKFFDSMKQFLKEAADEICRVKAEERKAMSLVKEVTQYFHGDTAKQEGHALRIFTVIRDFLTVLDNVCKDVGRMQDRTTMGSGRSFRISATTPLPVLNRCNVGNETSSDDDSM